jgi:hypothetical protein
MDEKRKGEPKDRRPPGVGQQRRPLAEKDQNQRTPKAEDDRMDDE